MDKFSEMSHAERIEYLASKVALAKSYDSPVLTVPIPDLEILLAELEAKDDALRAIAFHVSVGGYNADSVDAEVFKQKIIDGINDISDVLVKRTAELERANKAQDDHINQQQDRIDSLEKKNSDLGSALGSTEKLLEDRLEKWQELASNQVIKINELQAKLATPVRLPELCGDGENDNEYTEGLNDGINQSAKAVRAAGFTVGDE